ncbi:chaplin family protein [Sinosporangium siamense]|uniref:Chaplin domain-containing protein n=1 Tax=Sinosporangium siamense TaxID=1367973 RepID=A0A919RP97_9ACTN|nr:chaplin family protein [Sinosporangium siamense]GII95664.1 hypothetical protein Ssi02_58950 [Sinosporangium siamense]
MFKNTLKTGIVALGVTGLMALGAPAAMADATATGGTTSGAASILGGNQVKIPVSVPISACGIPVSVIGQGIAGCKGGIG